MHSFPRRGALAVLLALAAGGARARPADAGNFYTSGLVTVQKARFQTLYGPAVAGNLYAPKALDRGAGHAAIVVGHPMGAVKEQSANLYATKMAEQGFVALSIDLPCWGESEGPRNRVLPDMYAEAFSAAVDFLGMQPLVDRGRIGAIGICGSGSFAISAAKIDPRMRAVAYRRAAEPKELHVVPGAGHVDLYDRLNLIPWDGLTAFFRQHLGQA